MGKKKVAEHVGEAAAPSAAAAGTSSAPRSKRSRRVERGRVYISASYNNTVVTVTDEAGNTLAWATAGSLGFSGPKKATPFASSKVVAAIAEKVKPLGLTTLDIFVRGVGGGRDGAMRSLLNQGFTINSIKDVTPIPHNGPRPRKVRRV
ncbi:MAG: 30S ribosomal protein S11 [Candidatus Liptonbacteria bacterium]|nr:30S ribosomal protein S11 [Candidatus Liptonbacteria bacterium]